MSGITIGIYILMIAAIVAAIFALEYKNLMVSVISLIAMNLFIWGVLLIFDAILLAWVQLIVYGGGLTALFIVVVALTERQLDETFDWRRTVIALSAIAIARFTPSGVATILVCGIKMPLYSATIFRGSM